MKIHFKPALPHNDNTPCIFLTLDDIVTHYPLTRVHLPKDIKEVTVGDLHANVMKFLYTLVVHDMVTLSVEQYHTLSQIYYTDTNELTTGQLEQFKNILATMTLKNPDIKLRLIGDETADRGMNDYYILQMMSWLKKMDERQGIADKFTCIYSNHGAEFVDAYELYEKIGRFESPLLGGDSGPKQARSVMNLQKLIDRELVTFEEIKSLIDTAYKPYLKLLDYTLDENHKTFIFYSHAPIDLKCIPTLSTTFGVPCDVSTPHALGKTIDQLNTAFQKLVNKNAVHTLYLNRIEEQAKLGKEIISSDTYFHQDPESILIAILWNRTEPHQSTRQILEREGNEFAHLGYHVHYVHGHDGCGKPHLNVSNIDDLFGKSRQIPEDHDRTTYKSFIVCAKTSAHELQARN